jgi:hypothetical protein
MSESFPTTFEEYNTSLASNLIRSLSTVGCLETLTKAAPLSAMLEALEHISKGNYDQQASPDFNTRQGQRRNSRAGPSQKERKSARKGTISMTDPKCITDLGISTPKSKTEADATTFELLQMLKDCLMVGSPYATSFAAELIFLPAIPEGSREQELRGGDQS